MSATKNDPSKTWKLGEQEITSTEEYTYLGDIITADGGNSENLKNRMERIQRTTRRVMADSQIDVLHSTGIKTFLDLHESKTIPAILVNKLTVKNGFLRKQTVKSSIEWKYGLT